MNLCQALPVVGVAGLRSNDGRQVPAPVRCTRPLLLTVQLLAALTANRAARAPGTHVEADPEGLVVGALAAKVIVWSLGYGEGPPTGVAACSWRCAAWEAVMVQLPRPGDGARVAGDGAGSVGRHGDGLPESPAVAFT